MRTVTKGRRQDIRLTLMTVVEHLDYADDVGFLSSKHQDAQIKAERLSKTVFTIDLKVNTKNTHVLRKNSRVNEPLMIDGKHLEDVEEFIYFGTKVTTTGDCDQEGNTRVNKANQAFAILKSVWRTTNLSVHEWNRIFRSNVLSDTTVTINGKLEVFQTNCLRRILKLYWPNTIIYEELRNRTGTDTLAEIIQTRRWRWLGHVCRTLSISITMTALR